MNQEIKTISPSKNEFQNIGTHQNCSLKNPFQNMGAERFQQTIANKKLINITEKRC